MAGDATIMAATSAHNDSVETSASRVRIKNRDIGAGFAEGLSRNAP